MTSWPPDCSSDSWCSCWLCIAELIGIENEVARATATLIAADARQEWLTDWAPFTRTTTLQAAE